MKIDWTNPDEIAALYEKQMAVKINCDGTGSPSLFVIGRHKPENLVQPEEVFKGIFSKIVLCKIRKNDEGEIVEKFGNIEIPFDAEVKDPTWRKIAFVLWLWDIERRGTEDPAKQPFGEITLVGSLDHSLCVHCEPLP